MREGAWGPRDPRFGPTEEAGLPPAARAASSCSGPMQWPMQPVQQLIIMQPPMQPMQQPVQPPMQPMQRPVQPPMQPMQQPVQPPMQPMQQPVQPPLQQPMRQPRFGINALWPGARRV